MLRKALVAAALLGGIGAAAAGDDTPRFEARPPGTPAPRVVLVLGSGGHRGFAHIGALKALEEGGVKPDLIIGSSIGAVVGALYASGTRAAELEEYAYKLSFFEFLEPRMLVGMPATGRGTQNFVNRQLQGRNIEELPIPFAAAATRVRDNALVLFNRGDTGMAVRASAANPDGFEPVEIGGETYVDGDEASPVPIRAARNMGARVVIAIDVSAYLKSTPASAPARWIEKDKRRAKQIAAEAPGADVMIHPDIGYYAGRSESYRRRVIGIAYRVTREKIPAVLGAIARAK